MLKIKNPRKISLNNIKKFFSNLGLDEMIKSSNEPELKVNEMKVNNPYKPDLKDLDYIIYYKQQKNNCDGIWFGRF